MGLLFKTSVVHYFLRLYMAKTIEAILHASWMKWGKETSPSFAQYHSLWQNCNASSIWKFTSEKQWNYTKTPSKSSKQGKLHKIRTINLWSINTQQQPKTFPTEFYFMTSTMPPFWFRNTKTNFKLRKECLKCAEIKLNIQL